MTDRRTPPPPRSTQLRPGRIRAPVPRVVRSTIPPRRAPSRHLPGGAILVLCALSFVLGFLSKELFGGAERAPEGPVSTSTRALAPAPAAGAAPLVITSTAGLCPCPPPRKAKPAKALAIKRKKSPPVETPPFVAPDPTAETAKYLRDRARELGDCAPQSGGEVRVHLEVTVSPDGEIEAVKIANLEPLPQELASCVEELVSSFDPPGFDASESETFALTVVL